MVRGEVIRRKLAHLSSYLEELAVHEKDDLDAYVRSGGPRREIERLIQLIVDTAVDINVHVVTEVSGMAPESLSRVLP